MADNPSNPEFFPGDLNSNTLFSILSKVFVWALIFGILYILRSFFLLVFLTFVFAYIQNHGTQKLLPYIKNRTLSVIVVGVSFLALLIAIGTFLIPNVTKQAAHFADKYPSYVKSIDDEIGSLAQKYPPIADFLTPSPSPESETGDTAQWSAKHSQTSQVIHLLLGIQANDSSDQSIKQVATVIRDVGKILIAAGSSFFLALLFSFLIVLDLSLLTKSIKSLANSRLAFVYHEVADSVVNFGKMLGRALEAQLIIAMCNTLLTALLIYSIGLKSKIAFLSLIVFISSFIPIVGVFISSVPICLLVLQDSGFGMVLITALAIWGIHLVEAYILNPKIYGHHLRLNPVMVLIILTIGGKLFHVWGLILALPVCTYIFGYAIKKNPNEEFSI